VETLAMFIKVLKDAEVITNQNQTSLFKIVAGIFQTPQSQNISPASFKNKYYEADQKSRKAVENLLYLMLKKIKALHFIPLLLFIEWSDLIDSMDVLMVA
jgi:hypothetical protein